MMDPLGVCVATFGAMGALRLAQHLKDSRKNWGRVARLPTVLAETQDGNRAVRVVVLHIRGVELSPQCGGRRFTIDVKYGACGTSVRCDAASFSPSLPAARHLVHRKPTWAARSELSSTCLFLHSEALVPVIRLAVREAGPGLRRRTIARAGASLLQLRQRRAVKLPLRGGLASGQVSVACEVLEVRCRDLVDGLALAHAGRQRDAYLVTGAVPIVPGELVGGSGAGSGARRDFPVGSPCSAP